MYGDDWGMFLVSPKAEMFQCTFVSDFFVICGCYQSGTEASATAATHSVNINPHVLLLYVVL